MTDAWKPQLSFYLKLFQLPVTNCLVHIEFHYITKYGQHIVPLNSTWDACAFMANRKRFKTFQRVYDMIGQYTNVNHSCPYKHDIISNMLLDSKKIPFPLWTGEYLIKS
ncbi:uncharacterized protein LOC142239534 [Haematobia irritans]|uniref:uncharacterized protein LOC142239534 n=1 Tax=Haematobia irritans TaxID=7368 RepID=UPI003F503BBE